MGLGVGAGVGKPPVNDPAGDDHVDVRVMGHGRSPGMEHRSDADAGAKMLGIGGDGQQRLGRGLEQQIVDNRLIVPGDPGDQIGRAHV